MRFEFARERSDPPVKLLSVIEFPVLAELQGRNGIGKSLSVKLLQLLTGDQPWHDDEAEAWRTLRERLGPTSVTASGLKGAESIEWDLIPAAWPPEPPTDVMELFVPSDGVIGVEARIDGQPADLRTITKLLKVHRLVGDETLAESVRAQVRELQAHADDEAAAIRDLSEQVDEVLREAYDLLEPLSGRVVRHLEQRASELATERNKVAKEAGAVRRRNEALRVLERRLQSLQRLKALHALDPTDQLQQDLDALNKRIAKVKSDRDSTFDAAIADVKVRQRIAELRSEAERVESLLERAVEDARVAAAAADLDYDTLNADSVAQAHDELTREIVGLRHEQASNDALPLVRRAAASIKNSLNRVEPQSLLEHDFVKLDERALTGRQLVSGIDAQLRELNAVERSPSAEQLEHHLSAATQRLQSLVELQRALARQRRHTTALRNRRADLFKVTGEGGSHASQRYTELEALLARLEDERRELQGRHLRHSILLDELGPGETLEGAGKRLSRDLHAAGVVVEDDLADTRATTDASLADMEYRFRDCDVKLQETLRSLESAKDRRQLGVEALRQGRLIKALQENGLTVDGSMDEQTLELFAEGLLRAVDGVRGILATARRESDGLAGAFNLIDRDKLGDQDVRLIERVRSFAEERIVESLNQPVLQRELFGQGKVEGYDHVRKIVMFRPAGYPTTVTRSLSAFSSGERVFAYTQMRLRAIAERDDHCSNRLVALDEFGAFLESRRIRSLEGLVREELLGQGIDRVMFILPLTGGQDVGEEGYVVVDRSTA